MSSAITSAHTMRTTTPFVGRCPPDAVDCYRILSAWEIVTLCIALIAFVFQIALFNFLIRQVLSGHEYFSSSFYKLFCVLSFIEILHGLQDSFYQRVFNYGLFLDVFEGNEALCRIDYFISGYFSYFQCFLHLIIATNRFTVFVFPLRYKTIWKRKVIMYALLLNALLPLPFLSFRIPAKAMYYYVGPDEMGIKYIDKTVGFYAGLTSASISVFTSLASAILEVSALIAFRKLARRFPVSQENWNNLRLLGCTILMLISQALLTAYHCCMMYGNFFNAPNVIDFAQLNVSWVFDQFCFTSSICLFLARKQFERMSSSAKRVQKLRQGQSEDETKAENAKNAQRRREKRAAQKNAKMDDSKNLEKKTPTEVSSMDESSSLAADDSGFGKIAHRIQKENPSSRYSSPDDDSQCGDDSSQQLSLGLPHAMNLFRFSCSVMQLRDAFFLAALICLQNKENFLLRSSSPDDDSQRGDDSSLQLNVGLLHRKNRFFNSCSTMHLRNTHLPVVLILPTETLMDFAFGNVDRHGSSKLRWIGSVASQFVLL
ncbi:srg family chemoreceptor domain-containing protein [Ditylenchus destructor]|nr:srg family chemoreceptor domain-containing protein [Ditylenchus destructor]